MDKRSKSIIPIAKKYCRVCGAQAFGFNFNGLSCESCKAFFRRAVFKNDLDCKNESTCKVNRITRANCRKCRFDKCVAIGMEKELVSCLPKRKNQPKMKQIVLPIDRINLFSNERTLNLKIYELSRLGELHKAARAFPDESSWQIVGQVPMGNVSQLVNLSAANIKHIVRFCKNMSEFNCLTKKEQVFALKSFVPEINPISVAFVYNTETNGWAALEHLESDKRAVYVKMENFKSWIEVENYNFFSDFIIDLHQEMENDPAIRDLILVQGVFKHLPKMGSNHDFVRYHNVVLHYLLRRYLEHKYLDTKRATQKYTSLMGLMAKMDTITKSVKEFYTSRHITKLSTQVAPVLREIYNLVQT